ncbi:hypothetical protein [Paenibacillus sambharensis]|uniref:hypothetical protein n=1 Tax=Paenibacillus sambharensis TaxID=1803190 RepID=UPI0015E8873F|nr:hypothetical protein [Paenibacillus sambharensis]
MFTLKEKEYMLEVLKRDKRKSLFKLRQSPPEHDRLIEKLEQMIRNEQVNREHL